MALNYILNPEQEESFGDINNNVFHNIDPSLIDIGNLDFGNVDSLAGIAGYNQSQTSQDAPFSAMLENDLDYMQHGVQDWAITAVQDGPLPSSTSSQESTDDSSSESPGVLSQSESRGLSSPPSLNDASLEGQQICYGMICHIDVKLTGDMADLTNHLRQCKESSKGEIQRFHLQVKSDHILLLLPNKTHFGYLHEQITKVLTPELNREEFEFEAVAPYGRIFKKIAKVSKAGDAIVQVDVNVYGPSEKATEIGDKLSKAKAWLQRPEFHKPNSIYENPHVVKYPDIAELSQTEILRNEAVNDESDDMPNIDGFIQQIDRSTHRAAGLERATADRRLQTSLLEHQEKGLTFMLERESGEVPEDFRLWKPEIIDGREMWVPRCQSALRPEENGGGILADEMGMGKSLSILSLLLKTTEEGEKWAEDKNSEDLTHSDVEIYAQSTLIIVPSALLINSWMREIEIHIGNVVKVTKYHGEKRERETKSLAKADIVLTTYKTLATDFESNKSPMHSMGWFRVVLDEAHNIRRPATTYHKACMGLTARSRWCLSGTPIQNRLEDIGALFTFLRVEQFKSMARFRWYVVVPYERGDRTAIERLVMLYDSVVLRRTKDVLVLPGQETRTRELVLSPAERLHYQRTEAVLNRSIRQFRGEHEVASQFGLFQAHLQLRIFCNHGTHQKLFSWKNKKMAEEAMLMETGPNAQRVCAVCRQPEPAIFSTRVQEVFLCKFDHVFCQECLEATLEYSQQQETSETQKRCPLCDLGQRSRKRKRGRRGAPEIQDVVMRDADDEGAKGGEGYFDPKGYSTKMNALVADVKETLNETVVQENNTRRKAKSIIFSCWTRTLDLVELYLKREGIDFHRVDGEMLMSKRQTILDRFSQPGGHQIMLMTTGTGAFGLNLTAANRIFIVELQWNPSVEYQAIARAIRLRQKDKVIVTRYLMLDTVEMEMKKQQLNKELAAKAGWKEKKRSNGNS